MSQVLRSTATFWVFFWIIFCRLKLSPHRSATRNPPDSYCQHTSYPVSSDGDFSVLTRNLKGEPVDCRWRRSSLITETDKRRCQLFCKKLDKKSDWLTDWLGGEVLWAHLSLTEGRMTPPPSSGFLLTLSSVLGNCHQSVTSSISYKLAHTDGKVSHYLTFKIIQWFSHSESPLLFVWYHYISSLNISSVESPHWLG